MDRYVLRIPVVGEIIDKSSVARFARVLSTTFAAGVPLVDALESVAGATGNAVFRDAVKRIREEVVFRYTTTVLHAFHRGISGHGGANGGDR